MAIEEDLKAARKKEMKEKIEEHDSMRLTTNIESPKESSFSIPEEAII